MLFAALAPAAAARTQGLSEARAALATARQERAAHQAAAAQARARVQAQAATAARLAGQQVAAAASLRGLEDQTALAASTFASLQDQAEAAARDLQRNAAALAVLLPVMQRLAAEPAASLLAVPQPPVVAVRGLVVMQAIAAEIARRAAAVKQQTAALATLTGRTVAEQAVLAQRVVAQGKAEAALTAQISAAKAAEMAAAQVAARERAAALAADRKLTNLNDIVTSLMAMPAPPAAMSVPPPAFSGAPAAPPAGDGAPVAGEIIEAFGAPTVAGPAQGVSYRAAPGARVVTPCAGAVRFADRFQSYGLVVIADCGHGDYVVLSGLDHIDVTAGERLARRQPVGEMLGYDPAAPARQPVLYVELRHDGTPVDPTAWLANRSG